jgi:acyl carrier protein
MAEAANTTWGTNGSLSRSGESARPCAEEELREALRHCSAATFAAACRFRLQGDAAQLPAIILGLIERHVEPDLRAKLREPDDSLRLVEDLGLDSLTMIEIATLAEDVFRVSISAKELCTLRTVGDFKQFMTLKLCGLAVPGAAKLLPEGWC